MKQIKASRGSAKTHKLGANYAIAIQKSILLLKHCAKLFLLSLTVCTNK